MAQHLLRLGLLAVSAIGVIANDQEPLGDYPEACPDYVTYSSHPQ